MINVHAAAIPEASVTPSYPVEAHSAIYPAAASRVLLDYLRCPKELVRFEVASGLSRETGFFKFGGQICHGRAVGRPVPTLEHGAPDVADRTRFEADRVIW